MLFDYWLHREATYAFKVYFGLFILSCIILSLIHLFTKFELKFDTYPVRVTFISFKLCILFFVSLNSIINLCLVFMFNNINYNFYKYEIDQITFNTTTHLLISNVLTIPFFNATTFSLTKFNLSFILLFSFLYPIIFSFLSYDFNCYTTDVYLRLYYIFFLSYTILIVENIILFYFAYELLLLLVYSAMMLSSNSRGSVEASLFYLGWAILGSIFVGLGFLILILKTNYTYFFNLKDNRLTYNETYYIYLLLFFGFGIKLSVWPFWYWLPKAHVEVSTGMSIFLSCILIKLSLFSLLRLQHCLLSEIPLNICIFVSALCAFDIVFRFANLQDLKAMIAYGSVLHTNLLVVLIHLDSFRSIKNSIFYIWGHSLSTTTLFIIVNLIETRYSSRNILNVTGLWYTSPLLAKFSVFSLLSFLDIPLTLFFWGEIYLWECFIFNFLTIAAQVMVLVSIIFMAIFFKVWWNVLFGTPDSATSIVSFNDLNYDTNFCLLWLNIVQVILGLQPNLLSFLCGFYI